MDVQSRYAIVLKSTWSLHHGCIDFSINFGTNFVLIKTRSDSSICLLDPWYPRAQPSRPIYLIGSSPLLIYHCDWMRYASTMWE